MTAASWPWLRSSRTTGSSGERCPSAGIAAKRKRAMAQTFACGRARGIGEVPGLDQGAGSRTVSAVSDPALVLVGLAITLGIVGVVVPVLPGALLVWAAILVWALAVGSATGWAVLACATVVIGVAQVVKVLIPGRRLRDAGVPRQSLWVGAGVAVVGFFVIPVVGLFLGFPLGVYAEERRRLGAHAPAWESTVHALRAIGLSIAIELGAATVA